MEGEKEVRVIVGEEQVFLYGMVLNFFFWGVVLSRNDLLWNLPSSLFRICYSDS